MTAPGAKPPPAFSLTRGGLLFRWARRLKSDPTTPAGARRLLLALLALTWLPPVMLTLLERLTSGEWDPLLFRYEVHVRLLVVLPLLVLGERQLEARAASMAAWVSTGGVLDADGVTRWRGALARVGRLRDALWPEVLALALVYAVILGSLWELVPPWALRWVTPAVEDARLLAQPRSPAWWWYVLVGQPVLAVLLLRWSWLWTLWSGLMVRLSELPLGLQPLHTDRAGGLEVLTQPLLAFRFALLAVALGLAAVWADMILAEVTIPAAFAGVFTAFLALTYAFGFGPYLAFTPKLVDARHAGLETYSALVRRYAARFHQRWIVEHGASEEILGHSDFSGLADLGSSFQVVTEMRSTVFDNGALLLHGVVASGPILLVGLTHNVSLVDVLRAFFSRVLGIGG